MKSLGAIILAGLACFAILLLWPKPYHEPGMDDLFVSEPAIAPQKTADLGGR